MAELAPGIRRTMNALSNRLMKNYLRIGGRLKKSDAIFVFGSDRRCAAEKAAYLYHKGLAPLIVFTGGVGGRFNMGGKVSEAEYLLKIALDMDVPSECMIAEKESTNTNENVRFGMRELFKKVRDVHRLMLVSLPYQQLRQWATFEKVRRTRDIPQMTDMEVINCPAYYKMESLDKPVFLQDVDRIIGEVNRIKKYRGSFIADMPELDIPPEIDEQHKRLEELYHKVVHNNKISD